MDLFNSNENHVIANVEIQTTVIKQRTVRFLFFSVKYCCEIRINNDIPIFKISYKNIRFLNKNIYFKFITNLLFFNHLKYSVS